MCLKACLNMSLLKLVSSFMCLMSVRPKLSLLCTVCLATRVIRLFMLVLLFNRLTILRPTSAELTLTMTRYVATMGSLKRRPTGVHRCMR